MVSYGTQVIGDKSKFMITKPVSNEWNLAIRNIVPTDEAVYTCKLDNGEVLTRRRLMVQSKCTWISLYGMYIVFGVSATKPVTWALSLGVTMYMFEHMASAHILNN